MSTENQGGYYYDLFKFFSENHGLILVDTEIQDIIRAVEKFDEDKRIEAQAAADIELAKDDPLHWDEEYEELDDDRNAFDWQCPECCGENGRHAMDCPETVYGAYLRDGYD